MSTTEEKPSASLLLRNLSHTSTPELVKEFFTKFGEVKDVYLPLHFNTQLPRGFGFVEFHKHENAKSCLEALDGVATINGNEVTVAAAKQARKSADSMRYVRAGGEREGRGFPNGKPYYHNFTTVDHLHHSSRGFPNNDGVSMMMMRPNARRNLQFYNRYACYESPRDPVHDLQVQHLQQVPYLEYGAGRRVSRLPDAAAVAERIPGRHGYNRSLSSSNKSRNGFNNNNSYNSSSNQYDRYNKYEYNNRYMNEEPFQMRRSGERYSVPYEGCQESNSNSSRSSRYNSYRRERSSNINPELYNRSSSSSSVNLHTHKYERNRFNIYNNDNKIEHLCDNNQYDYQHQQQQQYHNHNNHNHDARQHRDGFSGDILNSGYDCDGGIQSGEMRADPTVPAIIYPAGSGGPVNVRPDHRMLSQSYRPHRFYNHNSSRNAAAINSSSSTNSSSSSYNHTRNRFL